MFQILVTIEEHLKGLWGYIIMIHSCIQQGCRIQAFQISGEHAHHPSRERLAIEYSNHRCLDLYPLSEPGIHDLESIYLLVQTDYKESSGKTA